MAEKITTNNEATVLKQSKNIMLCDCMGLELVKEFGSSLNSWKNMLIFGDNYPMLKELLKEQNLSEKVRLVYIDPPFSTNGFFRGNKFRTATISASQKDELAYEDKLVGKEYLGFLKERLILLRKILAEDGAIYLHIDYKVGHYVKVLMDEVFGKKHFINDITRIKSNPKNFQRKGFGNIKDMLLFYCKDKNYVWNEQRQEFAGKDVIRRFPKVDKKGRRYTTIPLHAPGETQNGATGQKWRGMPPPKGRHWRSNPKELDDLDKKGLIEWSKNGVPRKIIYANEQTKKGMKMQDIWEFKDPQYPKYPTEKNLEMLKLIIKTSSNKGDIVMDAFCGGSTTLVASEELGRKWVGIDNSPLAIKTTIRRLNNLKSIGRWGFFKEEGKALPQCIQKILQ